MTALAEEIANYYPDPQVRKRILNLLADSIDLADEGVDGCWSLTNKNRNSIRLTVGFIACFRAGPVSKKELSDLDSAGLTNWAGGHDFYLTISTAPGALSEASERLAERFNSYQFERPSDAISVRIPVGQMDELLPHFLPAHHAVIERLRTWKGSGRGFSTEVFEFIQNETGRELPHSPHDPLPNRRMSSND